MRPGNGLKKYLRVSEFCKAPLLFTIYARLPHYRDKCALDRETFALVLHGSPPLSLSLSQSQSQDLYAKSYSNPEETDEQVTEHRTWNGRTANAIEGLPYE